VKSAQNALIGVAAFLLALAFAIREGRAQAQKPSPRLIWERFPKFVLGFILASVLYTLGIIDGGKGTLIDALKKLGLYLCLCRHGPGAFREGVPRHGLAAVSVFLITTVFNLLLALGTAWVIFGTTCSPSPRRCFPQQAGWPRQRAKSEHRRGHRCSLQTGGRLLQPLQLLAHPERLPLPSHSSACVPVPPRLPGL
jgi:hypothetical protein